jgi:serine/threonine protein kinase
VTIACSHCGAANGDFNPRCSSCGAELPELSATPPGAAALPSRADIDERAYALGDELARGGCGRIVEAHDRRLGRPVALKVPLHATHDTRRRFTHEALRTARLQHPSIVPVYEAGRLPAGDPFFAMKLVRGRSLREIVDAAPSLDERLALLPNLIAVAEAVAYAHDQRIMHRDLKPSNVLIGAFGETVVLDWGLAKDLSAKDGSEAADAGTAIDDQTATGAVVGTLRYMAPEQAAGKPIDERADVYALGAPERGHGELSPERTPNTGRDVSNRGGCGTAIGPGPVSRRASEGWRRGCRRGA